MSASTLQPRSYAYGWYALGVLIVAYTLSYVDRTILTLMVGPIRASLHISDLQVSLLHGLAFAIFYTLLGVPIGSLVDRYERPRIIAVGVFVWSIMTALCGLARSFGTMFLARIGVGVGEASLSPAAFSILSDYFSSESLPRALSIFTAAMYVGSGLALMAGGAVIGVVPALDLPLVGHLEQWQVVFLIVGAPGIVVAFWVGTLREPVRRDLVQASPASSVEQPSMRQVWGHIVGLRRAYVGLIVGLSLCSLGWNGVSTWIPTYFIRNFGWTASQIGTGFGAVLLLCGPTGILTGSYLADFLRRRGDKAVAMRVGIVSAVLIVPFGIGATMAQVPELALILFGGFVFCASLPYGNGAAALQAITPNRMRGQISAVYIFGINLAGIGLGPTILAMVSRWLGGDMMLGSAMGCIICFSAVGGILILASGIRPFTAALDSAEVANVVPIQQR